MDFPSRKSSLVELRIPPSRSYVTSLRRKRSSPSCHRESPIRDVIESKHVEEALRERESRFRAQVENASYGISWATPEGQLLDANAALATMLGHDSVRELLNHPDTQALYCDPSAREKLFAECRKSGRAEATVDWKRKDGSILNVRLRCRQTFDAERESECIEITAEDATERTAIEKKLFQGQKFEAIGQLAGGIAHDLNNMIGAILGWVDLGIEEAEEGTHLHRYFTKVRRQAERATALTRQLLAFASRQILEPRDMDLNQSVLETLSLLEKVIGSNIKIQANLAPDLAMVRADPTQIEQVLMNLCINARDAMPEGGSLIVETSNTTFDERFCELQPQAQPCRYGVLSVTDTGMGMDSATLDRIFEPFFTTKEVGKGTGLGLATVYGVVKQHGGFMHVYSETGIGSTFRAYFPASAAPIPLSSRTAPEDSRAAHGGSETILVAEDHDGLRQLAYETLTNLGYRVLAAADGEHALEEFQSGPSRIHLALLDVVLPKLSGPEICAIMRAKKPGMPVIFVTGYGADSALLEQMQREGLAVLQKPYSPRDLARKIRETLDQHAELHAHK
jgi:two-component system, cell cycle sensor histidine kinase and response regulator CckA